MRVEPHGFGVDRDNILLLFSNQRTMTLKPGDLAEYRGARSQRGGLLPRGWRKVDRVAVAPAS
jgi:topoisomerase-4 subunit A